MACILTWYRGLHGKLTPYKAMVLSLYTTFPSLEEAKRVMRLLLSQQLVACANVMEQGMSLYSWQGKQVEEPEWVCIAKTTSTQKKALIRMLKKNHPYEVPCILFWEVKGGYAPYLDWVSKSLGS